MLLFVYGPYMDPKYLEEKGIKIICMRKSILKDYVICFSTKTNDWKDAMIDLKESKGDKVEGVVYEINDYTMAIFDNHENVTTGKHKRIKLKLETDNNEIIEAYTFISPIKEGEFKPSKEYLDMIIKGARLNNLSDEYIEFIKSFNN